MARSTSYEQIMKDYFPSYGTPQEWVEAYLLWISEVSRDTNYYTDENGAERAIKPVDHHPELKEYQVWERGYVVTGNSGPDHVAGVVKARNFRSACDLLMARKYVEFLEEGLLPQSIDYSFRPGVWCYDNRNLSFWGCALYWDSSFKRPDHT